MTHDSKFREDAEMPLRDRLEMLLEERISFLPLLTEKYEKFGRSDRGVAATSLASFVRFIGVAKYCLYNDELAFRAGVAEAARLKLNLFRRFEAGEGVSPSFVSMLAYKSLFDALASGDEGLALEFASVLGGRPEIEQAEDREIDVLFGYALKYLVQRDQARTEQIALLDQACKRKSNVNFSSYPVLMKAISEGRSDLAQSAVAGLVSGHRKESRGRGMFSLREDELISVWGVGILSLARMRGLAVVGDDDLIPNALLA